MTLRTENLTVSYGTDKVLNDVSLSLPTGKITALIGPNGCGKSTLLNCFSRLLMPQSGTVFLGDNPINMLSSRQLARRLSLLPQHHLTPEGITVQELVSYGRNPWLSLWGRLSAEDNARVNVAMNQTRINHLAVRRLTELSGGQRQRAFLAKKGEGRARLPSLYASFGKLGETPTHEDIIDNNRSINWPV